MGGMGTTQTATYKGSRNNYLNSITVTGYDLTPEFKKTNNTYFLTVGNEVTNVSVNTTKEDSSAVVTASGNTNLKVGLNKVLISVLAKNGDVRYYRIYVTRQSLDETLTWIIHKISFRNFSSVITKRGLDYE